MEGLGFYRYNLPIILLLSETGELNLSEIRSNLLIRSAGGVNNAVDKLEELGLVKKRVEKPITIKVSLTEKGRRVAEVLVQVKEILEA